MVNEIRNNNNKETLLTTKYHLVPFMVQVSKFFWGSGYSLYRRAKATSSIFIPCSLTLNGETRLLFQTKTFFRPGLGKPLFCLCSSNRKEFPPELLQRHCFLHCFVENIPLIKWSCQTFDSSSNNFCIHNSRCFASSVKTHLSAGDLYFIWNHSLQ